MAGNDVYHEGMRQLQDIRETRTLADRLQQVTMRNIFTKDDRNLIEQSPMVFVATADAQGRPDCSYKGGMPGFIKVIDERTLLIPDYDGNGMYRSWGNLLVNPNIGLLFLDFDNKQRLRVNGQAEIITEQSLVEGLIGAVFVIKITAETIFPNCPRYLHHLKLTEYSEYAPKENHTSPVPAWKTFDEFRDVLPDRDRQDHQQD